MSILQLLYTLFQWQYFGILIIIWIVIDLIWVDRWKSLIRRLGKLIVKPWIFSRDKEPNDPPLYPRELLEQLALNIGQESKSGDNFQKWMRAQSDLVFDAYNPIRSLGYVLALVFLIFFLLANAIFIANTLVLLGLMGDVPPLLQRLDLSIIGGTFLSAIVGVWIFIEMSGKSELINTDILSDAQKTIFRVLSVFVTIFSFAGMIALAVQRLILLGYLQTAVSTDLILSFILYGVLAINCSLSAAIVFQQAMSGLFVVIYFAIALINGFLPVLIFSVDILWRIVYIIVDLLLWVIFTPVLALPYGFSRIFGLI